MESCFHGSSDLHVHAVDLLEVAAAEGVAVQRKAYGEATSTDADEMMAACASSSSSSVFIGRAV
jgi:hypothetical protein